MPEKQIVLKQIRSEMTVLIRLLAYNITKDQKTIAEKAVILNRLGLSLSEIAVICGTSTGSISVRLAETKRKKKGEMVGKSPTE
jgi:DNA-directed RNA polymerase specialized sigma24 family protein